MGKFLSPLSHLLRKCQLSRRESQEGSLVRELDSPQAKTEGVFQISKIRIRFTLKRSCSRAAPSVAACVVQPSSERKALFSLYFCGGEQGELIAVEGQQPLRLQVAEFGG